MDRMLSRKATIAAFVLPGLLIFCVVYVFPIFYTLRLSVTDWEGLGPMNFVGQANYVKLFLRDKVFLTSVKNVFTVVAFGLVAQLIPALSLALALGYLRNKIRFYRNAFFIPVLMSASAVGIMWCEFYDVNHGALNALLGFVGLQGWSRDWLSDKATTLVAVILPAVWQWLGYHLILLYSSVRGIPDQYMEAARIDGCNALQTVWHVLLPLMRDPIKVSVVLATVGCLKYFDIVYVMTGGGPYNLTSTIALQMYKESFLKLQFGYGSTIAVVLCALCILVFVLINKLLTREAITY